jgi:hypothetical protein
MIMKFTEAFTGLNARNVVGLFIVVAGILVVGRPILHFVSQVCQLAADALPSVLGGK